jgi:hypothetical protein
VPAHLPAVEALREAVRGEKGLVAKVDDRMRKNALSDLPSPHLRFFLLRVLRKLRHVC